MKKVLITAAALSIVAGAANATGTAQTDATAAWNEISNAYSDFGAQVSAASITNYNSLLDGVADRIQTTTRQVPFTFLGRTYYRTEIVVTGSTNLNTIVSRADTLADGVVTDFVGSDMLAGTGTIVGDAVARVTTAATAYSTAAARADVTQSELTAAATAYNNAFMALTQQAAAAEAHIRNVTATFDGSSFTTATMANYTVALSDTAGAGNNLTFSSRVNAIKNDWNTHTVDIMGTDAQLPTGWVANGFPLSGTAADSFEIHGPGGTAITIPAGTIADLQSRIDSEIDAERSS